MIKKFLMFTLLVVAWFGVIVVTLNYLQGTL